jgi:pyridoxal 5'-phosphate synthase pdxS subunit
LNLLFSHPNSELFIPCCCAFVLRTEGAAFLRTKGEAGTGNVVEAVRHARAVNGEIKRLTTMDATELWAYSKNIQAPYELVKYVADNGRLPVVNFAAGGVATPADAGTSARRGALLSLTHGVFLSNYYPFFFTTALMMQLGMDGVFVGSGIFASDNPKARAEAMVQAVTHFRDAKKLAEISTGLGKAMVGINDLKKDPVNFRDREGNQQA